ncbi:MacB family efflux pump subunit [Suttonella ornithocola]|uniref:Pyoverdine export ATP-binding/permease protein PvdT n=1 Tax=Suttonella ornithocola TaxID=279832 RepID=A0A380MXW4_9GAMM|nr:MacB family efflux pump subunit [Suttonella ornithocola]SUO97399.1 Macrolide export ATP-binding/permease protein MacB [Suttonella ornithocola]
MDTPLIQTKNLIKRYGKGETEATILHGLNIEIYAGEMVAIIGQSGSGKSTLMNILGCLDRPTEGEYWIDGKNTQLLSNRERARLRREHIGFIFQRYHLLADLRARENVAIPAVYASIDRLARLQRADALLSRLGLSERINYKPSQLSGGQQQRVSIARALMNGGRIIFADEPTGALDSESGKEVMRILRELHADGHTIILVTHDPNIAASADRVIELKDGVILSDTQQTPRSINPPTPKQPAKGTDTLGLKALANAFHMAIRAILGHKLRAFLTMLGIIIGVASVVSMVALGQGSQQKVLAQISDLGSNTIQVFPGKFGERRAARIRTLTASDANILSEQSFIDSATPSINTSGTLRIGDKALNTSITGMGQQYFQVQNIPITQGRILSAADITHHAAVGYLDENGAHQLFPHQNPLGKVVLLNNMPLTIIGIVNVDNQMHFSNSNNVNIWMPYTSVMSRLLGQTYVSNIILRIADNIESAIAEDAVKRILIQRHGKEDFTLINNDAIRQTITQTTQTLTLLISAIAVISLIVGGIGVMNIMLVSVTERTQEIGIRMAVGARQSDIMRQFLIEAILLCLIGGILGIALAYGLGQLVSAISEFQMIYSMFSIIIAFACSTGIGILFGYLPAKNAAKLDPVEALSGE